MALIKCPECGNEISEMASACPKCGCPKSMMNQIKEQKEKNKKIIREYSHKMEIELDKNKLQSIYIEYDNTVKDQVNYDLTEQYKKNMDELNALEKPYPKFNFPEYSDLLNVIIEDLFHNEYYYKKILRENVEVYPKLFSLYMTFNGRLDYLSDGEEQKQYLSDTVSVLESSFANENAKNSRKLNPYFVGGLVDGILGSGAGLYAANETALHNQKVDAVRTDAKQKTLEAQKAQYRINNYNSMKKISIENLEKAAKQINAILDSTIPNERKEWLGDYYSKRMEEKHCKKIDIPQG